MLPNSQFINFGGTKVEITFSCDSVLLQDSQFNKLIDFHIRNDSKGKYVEAYLYKAISNTLKGNIASTSK